MSKDKNVSEDEGARYLDPVDQAAVIDEAKLTVTPAQHERLKQGLHGDVLKQIKRAGRRYLVIGRGDGDAGNRREAVVSQLNDRRDAIAFRLEEFGFSTNDIDLWAPAFDILAEMVTHIVGVLEDFDGGHVWELGYLYRYQTHVRNILWLLKRYYKTDAEMREKYDNGMAAAHLRALEEAVAERVIGWETSEELRKAVTTIP